jgi:hypothetical protein
MLRIDPLTETGVFDTEFFGSNEYTHHRKLVEQYLKDEGFDTTTDTITIQLGDHLWCVRNTSFGD